MHFGGHSVRPLTPISCDATSLYVVDGVQRNLPQIFVMRVRIAKRFSRLRGQKSRSYVYKCVNAITVE